MIFLFNDLVRINKKRGSRNVRLVFSNFFTLHFILNFAFKNKEKVYAIIIYRYLSLFAQANKVYTQMMIRRTIEVDCAKYMRIRVWIWNTWWFSSSNKTSLFRIRTQVLLVFFLKYKKTSWVWNMYVSRLDLAFNNFILFA